MTPGEIRLMRNQFAAAVHQLIKDFEARTDVKIIGIKVERIVRTDFSIGILKGVYVATEL